MLYQLLTNLYHWAQWKRRQTLGSPALLQSLFIIPRPLWVSTCTSQCHILERHSQNTLSSPACHYISPSIFFSPSFAHRGSDVPGIQITQSGRYTFLPALGTRKSFFVLFCLLARRGKGKNTSFLFPASKQGHKLTISTSVAMALLQLHTPGFADLQPATPPARRLTITRF